MEKDTNTENESFSLYTEKIVVSPFVKYKRVISIVRTCVIVAIIFLAGVMSAYFVSRMVKVKEENHVVPRTALTLEKDEYDKYSKSPTFPTEEPDLSANYKKIQRAMDRASQSIVPIGDNTVGILIGEVDGDYIIVTEYREGADSSSYYVKVSDAVNVAAEIINVDSHTGLALLAVDIETLNRAGVSPSVASIGNSYDARVNEIVMAIGRVQDNSEGYASGYITGMSTDSGVDIAYDILETNVELKVGDYVLLFDLNADFIGVSHVSTGSDSEKVENIIGISSLKWLIEKMSTGVPVAYLGIKSTNVTKDIAEQFHFPEGIYVTEVELDSPAYKAGIQAGDIIYEMDGETVSVAQDFSERILSYKTEDTVKIKLKRAGKGGEYRDIEYSAKLSSR